MGWLSGFGVTLRQIGRPKVTERFPKEKRPKPVRFHGRHVLNRYEDGMGIFLSLDLIAFFIFWELLLVPMYFLIQGWGSGRRDFAAMKFFIYTAAGSAFLLASTIVLAFLHQQDTGRLTFDYRILAEWNGLSGTTELLLFIGFMRSILGRCRGPSRFADGGKARAMLRPKSNPPHRRLIPARGREAHA